MATFIEFGFLEFYVPLISFIFIFLVLFAILQKTKMLGGKGFLDFIVSVFVTILVIMNDQALELANFLSVWSVVIIVILVFILLMFFSVAKEGDPGLPGDFDLKAIIFWTAVVILVIGLTQVFGPIFTPYGENAPKDWVVLRTIFHPKVIGALVIAIIIGNIAKLIKH